MIVAYILQECNFNFHFSLQKLYWKLGKFSVVLIPIPGWVECNCGYVIATSSTPALKKSEMGQHGEKSVCVLSLRLAFLW